MSSVVMLTIAIPVHNGERFVRQTLDSIVDQLTAHHLHAVEIVVSDNASTDRTGEIVASYVKLHPQVVRHFRNVENLGFDCNVDLAVTRASGQYVWLLGCGETLTPGCLRIVLESLSGRRFDNLLLNFHILSIREDGKAECQKNFNIDSDVSFSSKDDFLSRTITGITPISANIVFRASYMRVIESPLLETGWAHVERILDILMSDEYSGSKWISSCCFTLMRENDGWWTRNGNLLLNSMSVIRIYNSKLSSNFTDASSRLIRRTTWGWDSITNKIILAKQQNLHFSGALIYRMILLFRQYFWFWFVGLPLILVPRFVFKTQAFYFLHSTIRHRWLSTRRIS